MAGRFLACRLRSRIFLVFETLRSKWKLILLLLALKFHCLLASLTFSRLRGLRSLLPAKRPRDLNRQSASRKSLLGGTNCRLLPANVSAILPRRKLSLDRLWVVASSRLTVCAPAREPLSAGRSAKRRRRLRTC